MENLVGLRVADAAEQMRVGQRTLQRVIAAPKRFREGWQIGIDHLETAWIVLRQPCLALDDVQRRLSLRAGFREDECSVLKIECEQADFAGNCGAGRLPSKTPGDHQMEDE